MEHLRITVAGKTYDVIVEKINSSAPTNSTPVVRSAPAAPVLSQPAAPTPSPAATADSGDATSPLAGLVQAIDVQVGATVQVGDPVITLEAMKMYTAINASISGTITAIHVKVGDAVDEGQVLYTIH